MIRTLEPSADRLKITVLDEPGKGGPEHQHSNLYQITNLDGSTNPAWDGTNQHSVTIMMQNGPVPAGRAANGLTEEALLAIVIDRMMVSSGTVALHCHMALDALKAERGQREA